MSQTHGTQERHTLVAWPVVVHTRLVPKHRGFRTVPPRVSGTSPLPVTSPLPSSVPLPRTATVYPMVPGDT